MLTRKQQPKTRTSLEANRNYDTSSHATVTDSHIPEAYRRDVIAKIFIWELGRYIYASGRVLRFTEDSLGRKVARIRFHAPIRNQVRNILIQNVVTDGAFVEIHFAGEMVAVTIEQIDAQTMLVQDVYGETQWVKINSIRQVMTNDFLLYEVFTMERKIRIVAEIA